MFSQSCLETVAVVVCSSRGGASTAPTPLHPLQLSNQLLRVDPELLKHAPIVFMVDLVR